MSFIKQWFEDAGIEDYIILSAKLTAILYALLFALNIILVSIGSICIKDFVEISLISGPIILIAMVIVVFNFWAWYLVFQFFGLFFKRKE